MWASLDPLISFDKLRMSGHMSPQLPRQWGCAPLDSPDYSVSSPSSSRRRASAWPSRTSMRCGSVVRDSR